MSALTLPEVPESLRALLEAPRAPAAPRLSIKERLDLARRLDESTGGGLAVIIDRCAADLAARPVGERNDMLFAHAADLFGHVKGGHPDFTQAGVELALTQAGSQAGLTQKEIDGTLASAWRKTEAKPYKAPAPSMERQVAQMVAREAEKAPEVAQEALNGKLRPETRTERLEREEAEAKLSELEQKVVYIRSRLLDSEALKAMPPPAPLIDGILMRDSLAVLYGKPGNGKSFVAMDWALCVATGTWWDMRKVHQGPVLYIAAEGSAGLGKRLRAWTTHQNFYGPVPGFTVYPERINLLDSVAPAAMVVVAQELAPQLIVIDTLSRSMPGGNENAPEDMTRALENADWLRRETRATVVLVHHTPKDGGSIRGHSSLEGAADTAVEVKKSEAAVTISVEKQKDAPEDPPVTMYLTPVQLGAEPDSLADSAILTPIGSGSLSSSPDSEQKVLRALWESCGSEGLPTKLLMEIAGLPESTFHRAKKALEDRGAIQNLGTGGRPRWKPVLGVS